MKTKIVRDVPIWASQYLMYGEADDLSEEDIRQCDEFVRDLEKRGLRLACPDISAFNEFNPCPAFGLACGTEDWIAEVRRNRANN